MGDSVPVQLDGRDDEDAWSGHARVAAPQVTKAGKPSPRKERRPRRPGVKDEPADLLRTASRDSRVTLVLERHIRIALCDLPQMLDDIVTVLVRDEPSVDIVARIEHTGDLRSDFERSGADLVICALTERDMAVLWADALSRRPLPAFINLAGDSTRARLYAAYGVERALGELTAQSLLAAFDDHVRARQQGGARGALSRPGNSGGGTGL